jgi:hypothetical protein
MTGPLLVLAIVAVVLTVDVFVLAWCRSARRGDEMWRRALDREDERRAA